MFKEVNEAIELYDFEGALGLLEECTHNVEYYSVTKIKLLCLLERCDEATTFFSSISEDDRSEIICEAMVTGLIVNHRFVDATRLMLSSIKENPSYQKLKNSFQNALIQLGLLDLAYKFTLSFEAKITEFNVGQLTNLATMLLIKKKIKQSAYIFGLITKNFSINYWARITPWLMLAHGQKSEVCAELFALSKTQPHRVLNTHHHFSQYEYTDLYNYIVTSQSSIEPTAKPCEDDHAFVSLLEAPNTNTPFKYDFIKLCIWKYAHILQGAPVTFIERVRENTYMAALHDEAARSLYSSTAINLLQKKHSPEVVHIANLVKQVDGPVVFIASHLSYPGGLHTLYAKIDNIHYVKTPLGGDIEKEKAFNTIYIGPHFLQKPNLFELNRMLKVLKRKQTLLIKLDQQNQLLEKSSQPLNAQYEREYNFYFSQLIWETRATCMFIDVDFYNEQYHFTCEKLPHPNDYNQLDAWQSDVINEYDKHISARIRGERGKNNPALDDVTKSMLKQEYHHQFDSIDRLLSE
ncbi:hypothetical protein [Alteromonas sp. OM2203]|uniref:hypothetical protein n=1 Tax=Alteromonas sp. OM2203 TaxID=3398817 RepID=UPI003AF36FC7